MKLAQFLGVLLINFILCNNINACSGKEIDPTLKDGDFLENLDIVYRKDGKIVMWKCPVKECTFSRATLNFADMDRHEAVCHRYKPQMYSQRSPFFVEEDEYRFDQQMLPSGQASIVESNSIINTASQGYTLERSLKIPRCDEDLWKPGFEGIPQSEQYQTAAANNNHSPAMQHTLSQSKEPSTRAFASRLLPRYIDAADESECFTQTPNVNSYDDDYYDYGDDDRGFPV